MQHDPILWLITLLIGTSVFVGALIGGGMLSKWYHSYEEQYVEKTEHDLYGIFSNLSAQRVLQVSLTCFLVFSTIPLLIFGNFDSPMKSTLSGVISLMLGIFGALLPKIVIHRAGIMRLQKFDLQLLEALLSMSNALKAGFSIPQAFESVVQEGRNPISQEFDLFLREVRMGVKFENAADNLNRRIPSEDLKIVLTGIETARQTGGNLTEVFDRLAVVIRERMRVQGRIQSLTAQGRLQGWVVGLMPLILGIVIYYIQPGMMNSFVQSWMGIAAILTMLFLEVIGFFIIRKIVSIDI